MPVEYRPPSFVMRGAIAAFEGPWKPTADMATEYYKRIIYLHKRLNDINGLSCQKPEGTFYLFPNIEEVGKNSAEFTIDLAKLGKLLVMSGMAFGEAGENQIRLALVKPIEVLETAAQAIEEIIKKL
jgi:aspartate/methionine/tyrosine aminotransferase